MIGTVVGAEIYGKGPAGGSLADCSRRALRVFFPVTRPAIVAEIPAGEGDNSPRIEAGPLPVRGLFEGLLQSVVSRRELKTFFDEAARLLPVSLQEGGTGCKEMRVWIRTGLKASKRHVASFAEPDMQVKVHVREAGKSLEVIRRGIPQPSQQPHAGKIMPLLFELFQEPSQHSGL